MHVVVVPMDQDGKVHLTKDELQQMLDDAYSKGYAQGKSESPTITSPVYPLNPPWTITCNSQT